MIKQREGEKNPQKKMETKKTTPFDNLLVLQIKLKSDCFPVSNNPCNPYWQWGYTYQREKIKREWVGAGKVGSSMGGEDRERWWREKTGGMEGSGWLILDGWAYVTHPPANEDK